MNDDVIMYHSSAIYSLYGRSWPSVLKNRSGYVEFFMEGANDEVAIENVSSIDIH